MDERWDKINKNRKSKWTEVQEEPIKYGQIKAGEQAVFESDHIRVQLFNKLHHEGISRVNFFRAIIMGFIEDDEDIERFIARYKEKKDYFSKAKQDIYANERKLTKETKRLFGLDPDEIDDIFDLIEEELDL